MITSSSNSKIKLVRSLQASSKNRKAESAFVAEGVRLIEEAISVNWPLEFLLYDESISERGLALIASLKNKAGVDISEISPPLMAEISDTETPQGILAVLKREALPLPQSPNFIVIADQIRDPGNMGTLMRTTEAAGGDAVILTPGTVDAFSPKVVRSGMGAHFHLAVQHKDWDEIDSYLASIPVFLAESQGGIPLWEADLAADCALLIGGEAFGASPEGEARATQKITIPMKGRAESLNAAVAAAILIGEVLRQRYQH
ncbi:MAG: RNA methyltransferase [Chloroflexota bacterium]|nr:RNA methyltransferase [Chloroflexota bacterium]